MHGSRRGLYFTRNISVSNLEFDNAFSNLCHLRFCGFIVCTLAVHSEFRVSAERRGLELQRVMVEVWGIDWGHCFSFRSFIHVCGYRVIWLPLESIIKLLFIAALKEEVPCRHNRCQMDSLGGWRIVFIRVINAAWASAMRIPSHLLTICINCGRS